MLFAFAEQLRLQYFLGSERFVIENTEQHSAHCLVIVVILYLVRLLTVVRLYPRAHKYSMRLYEVVSNVVLYHGTTARYAFMILRDRQLNSSNDDVDQDKNNRYFISTTTNPDLWWAAGFRDTANVTFVLNKPTGYELETVDRWDEVRIILGDAPEDPYHLHLPEDHLTYPINRTSVREIWLRDQEGEDGDYKYLQLVRDQAKKLGIPVVEKPSKH